MHASADHPLALETVYLVATGADRRIIETWAVLSIWQSYESVGAWIVGPIAVSPADQSLALRFFPF
jgi:hypothetical protein